MKDFISFKDSRNATRVWECC